MILLPSLSEIEGSFYKYNQTYFNQSESAKVHPVGPPRNKINPPNPERASQDKKNYESDKTITLPVVTRSYNEYNYRSTHGKLVYTMTVIWIVTTVVANFVFLVELTN